MCIVFAVSYVIDLINRHETRHEKYFIGSLPNTSIINSLQSVRTGRQMWELVRGKDNNTTNYKVPK